MTIASAASGISSGSSSSSKTRSAEAIVDWMMFAILASCVIGWENCRAYWMNACTSPMAMARRVTMMPPMMLTKT